MSERVDSTERQVAHANKTGPERESVEAFLARGGQILQLNSGERGQSMDTPGGTLCRPKVRPQVKRAKETSMSSPSNNPQRPHPWTPIARPVEKEMPADGESIEAFLARGGQVERLDPGAAAHPVLRSAQQGKDQKSKGTAAGARHKRHK